MNTVNKIICILLLLISVLTYQFWYYFKEVHNINIFYVGIALLMQGFTYVIWKESKDMRFKYFMEFFVLLCFSNIVDEAFFNPTKIEANEIMVSFLLLIRFIFIVWKLTKNNALTSKSK